MAIVATKLKTDATITCNAGLDGDGKVILTNQKMSKIKLAATVDDIFAVTTAMGVVLADPVLGVVKVDSFNLVEE